MATKRIYVVGVDPDFLEIGEIATEKARLIEAPNAAQAIRHVASRYKAEVATTRQVADLVTAGVVVEVVGNE